MALGEALRGRQLEAWSSPLIRARETCSLAGFPDPVLDPDLQEWDYGIYEGRRTLDIRKENPALYGAAVRTFGTFTAARDAARIPWKPKRRGDGKAGARAAKGSRRGA